MFTVRYAQISYITHTSFVFERLIASTHERNNKPEQNVNLSQDTPYVTHSE
jgi:transcriptional regulatory protein LevR